LNNLLLRLRRTGDFGEAVTVPVILLKLLFLSKCLIKKLENGHIFPERYQKIILNPLSK